MYTIILISYTLNGRNRTMTLYEFMDKHLITTIFLAYLLAWALVNSMRALFNVPEEID